MHLMSIKLLLKKTTLTHFTHKVKSRYSGWMEKMQNKYMSSTFTQHITVWFLANENIFPPPLSLLPLTFFFCNFTSNGQDFMCTYYILFLTKFQPWPWIHKIYVLKNILFVLPTQNLIPCWYVIYNQQDFSGFMIEVIEIYNN